MRLSKREIKLLHELKEKHSIRAEVKNLATIASLVKSGMIMEDHDGSNKYLFTLFGKNYYTLNIEE